MSGTVDREAVEALLGAAGARLPFRLRRLEGGANNRGYRVEADGRAFFLKAYYRSPDDPRDRLAVEYAFAEAAWGAGVRRVPRPLAKDPERGLGLYDFVQGRTPAAEELGEAAVDQALAFYGELNAPGLRSAAGHLQDGAEACFSLAEHLRCVDRRLSSLLALPAATEVDAGASAFVKTTFAPGWARLRDRVGEGCRRLGLDPQARLPAGERRLSPSDFGFHNALLGPGGRLTFVDFEYAGWDDPAKVVCDFFCQERLPVSPAAYPRFAAAVASDLSEPERHLARFDLLLPVYRAKWVAILLNPFLPAGSRRRSYALSEGGDLERHKRRQLEKARAAWRRIGSEDGG